MANEHATLVSLFEDTANAIRERAGSTGQIVADTFPTAIRNIPKTNLQSSKTVIPSTSQQIITPDSGYDALSQIIVNALNLQSKTVTPSTSQQTIKPDSGYNALSQVVVNAINGKVVKTGTYTPTSDTKQFTITHSLGVVPDFCFCCVDYSAIADYMGGTLHNGAGYNPLLCYIYGTGLYIWPGSTFSVYVRKYDHTKSYSTLDSEYSLNTVQAAFPTCVTSVSTSKATFGDNSSYNSKFSSGKKYTWVVGKLN